MLEVLVLLGIEVVLHAIEHATVVVVDGHAHRALGVLLAHDVLRELVIDLVRRGKLLERQELLERALVIHVDIMGVARRAMNDVRAGGDALVADVDAVGALN